MPRKLSGGRNVSSEPYRVDLDAQWNLNDLYEFPHALNQSYAFYYCFSESIDRYDIARIDKALKGYPWQGGYSVVNFYHVLENRVPKENRPQIASIHYASPGWLDIVANHEIMEVISQGVDVISHGLSQKAAIAAGAVAAFPTLSKVIAATLKSAENAVRSYANIQSTLTEISQIKKAKQLAELSADHQILVHLRQISEELAMSLGMKSYAELVARTGSEEVAAKLLSAQYRRLETLAKFVHEGKARFPSAHKSKPTKKLDY